MEPDPDESEDLNLPDMAGVEYQVAIESLTKMYNDLRTAGMPRDDAAAVIAAIMTRSNI